MYNVIFSFDLELDVDETTRKDEIKPNESTFIILNNQSEDGKVDRVADSDSTATSSNVGGRFSNLYSSDTAIKPDEQNFDSEVTETAKILLSLHGSSKMMENKTSMNGSNNEHMARCRGLPDDGTKNLQLRKKNNSNGKPSLRSVGGTE